MRFTRPIQSSGLCSACCEQRLLERRGANHPLHLLLTVCTGGIWAIGWIAFAFNAAGKPYRCQTCGAEMMRMEEAGGVVAWEPLHLD